MRFVTPFFDSALSSLAYTVTILLCANDKYNISCVLLAQARPTMINHLTSLSVFVCSGIISELAQHFPMCSTLYLAVDVPHLRW